MIKKYFLFFTPVCPKCHKVKGFIQSIKMENEWVDATTDKGLEKAREFNVMNVPTVVFVDSNGKEVARASTIEEIKRVTENKSLV